MDIHDKRIICTVNYLQPYLTYIAEEGRFAINARMKQKFEDGHEWESWPRDKFLTNLLICWPAPNTQEGQSLEVMFRALEPKIHFTNAYNDVTRFVTNIKIFYAKEKINLLGWTTTLGVRMHS